ncbi:MAG TPA: hypothetical protein VGN11_05095 [Candidatus Baltobacteraceae bacterium]|jgi:hypothetical protein|nr:hypothetical protein [Candidatus Baltobacteraceae bacterium]
MKRKGAQPPSRAAQARRNVLLKAGIWVFLAIFIFSAVGVAIAFR